MAAPLSDQVEWAHQVLSGRADPIAGDDAADVDERTNNRLWGALNLVGRQPDDEGLTLAKQYLDDPRPEIAAEALSTLVLGRAPGASERALSLLGDADAHALVLARAIDALLSTHPSLLRENAAVLIRLQHHEVPVVANTARKALDAG